jgi:hypothetical protein
MPHNADSHTGLDPEDWSATRALGHRMLDDMIDWLAASRERPVWRQMPQSLRAQLREPLPHTGQEMPAIYEDFCRLILPFSSANEHPRMMGWVNGGGSAAGLLAELLTGIFNVNCGGRDHAAIEVERLVINWAAEMVGMPRQTTGVLLTGSSMANMVAVLVARRAALGEAVRTVGLQSAPLTAYASAAAHGCIPRALDMAGIGSDSLRLIPADSSHRMRTDLLADSIAQDRAAGKIPFLVVGTAGTVDTGAIDDLAAIAHIAATRKSGSMWTAPSAPPPPSAPDCVRDSPASTKPTAWLSISTNGRRCPTTPAACWCAIPPCTLKPSPNPSPISRRKPAAWPATRPGRATSAPTFPASSAP